jgi:hypothetical protein
MPTNTSTYVPQSDLGVADGVATLDGSGTVPDAQIPAAVTRDAEIAALVAALALTDFPAGLARDSPRSTPWSTPRRAR